MSEGYPRDLVGYGLGRRTLIGPAVHASPFSLSSTTKRVARTASYTATKPVKRFCPTSSAPSLAWAASPEHGVHVRIWQSSRCLAAAAFLKSVT